MLTQQQRDYLLPKAYNAALRAGAAILSVYSRTEEYDITIKSDKTPITIADRNAHNAIKEHLAQTHIPMLSEEGREMLYDERRGWDLFWMVDPLDGTKEFIKGNGEFTVNIALMVDNKPELAVLYVPYLGKMYFADSSRGAMMATDVAANADADFELDDIIAGGIQLPTASQANNPIKIAVSRSHNTDETLRLIDIMRRRFPDAEVVEQGSSYKFGLLAEGVVDCYVRTTNTYEWDTAAGELILAASGGRVVALPDKEPMEYNKITLLNPGFVCFSKFMHD